VQTVWVQADGWDLTSIRIGENWWRESSHLNRWAELSFHYGEFEGFTVAVDGIAAVFELASGLSRAAGTSRPVHRVDEKCGLLERWRAVQLKLDKLSGEAGITVLFSLISVFVLR